MSTQRYLEGRLDEIEVPLRAFVERYPTLAGWRCTLALLLAEQGRGAEAERELEVAAAAGFAGQRRDSHWLLAACRAADCAAKLGHEAAPRPARAAAPLRRPSGRARPRGHDLDRLGLPLPGPGRGRHGRTDSAVERLEAALADNPRWGARPWVAHAELDLAGILLDRAGRGDRERAASFSERARATAQELGLASWPSGSGPCARALGGP